MLKRKQLFAESIETNVHELLSIILNVFRLAALAGYKISVYLIVLFFPTRKNAKDRG